MASRPSPYFPFDMPLTLAPSGDMLGVLTDRFGVGWTAKIAGKRS